MITACVCCDEHTDATCCVTCNELPRSEQFVRLLNKLQQAATKSNPYDELTMIVKQIQRVSFLVVPIIYIPFKYFNPSVYDIDTIAQTYLSKCQ